MFKKTMSVLLGLLLSTLLCWGQTATGSIGGLVTDANGAAVPGANLTAKNEATGQEYKATSSDSGLYLFPTLLPGPYVLGAEKTGFKRMSRGNIEIRIAQRLDLDVQL